MRRSRLMAEQLLLASQTQAHFIQHLCLSQRTCKRLSAVTSPPPRLADSRCIVAAWYSARLGTGAPWS